MHRNLSILFRSALVCAALSPLASAQSVAFKCCGSLFVFGTNSADDLWLRGVDGNVNVAALGGATVNGAASVDFSGIWGPVFVATGGGDDIVRMTDSNRAGDVLIATGSGDDLFYAERNQFQRSLWVDSGSASVWGDTVALSGVGSDGNVVGRSLIVTGQHALVGARDCTVGRDIVLLTGSGADQFKIDGIVTVVGDVFACTGSNSDLVEFASFEGAVGNQIYGDVVIDTHSGDDDVRLGSAAGGVSTIGGETCVFLGSGNDLLTIQRTEFVGPVYLSGGDGADQATVADPLLGNVYGPFLANSFEQLN